MKHRISRFEPHQNAKVVAVLMAVGSLIFVVPLFLFALLFAPSELRSSDGSAFMFVLVPLFYLVVGYLMVLVACALYNFLFRYVGGIEFEASDPDTR